MRVGEPNPDAVIWRYLTFPKFVSLLTTRALWFSKLSILNDTLEGTMPERVRESVRRGYREMEEWFPDARRTQQVRQFVERNEESGRELLVASCWHAGTLELRRLWVEYVGGNEGVAIRSTPRDLANSLAVAHNKWWIGNVEYVGFERFDGMSAYQAHQAHLRAFLKDERFSHESELRIATMNLVSPGCLNPDGSPPTESQRSGLVYSTDRAGILVQSRLPLLIKEVRTAPGASKWHCNLIALLVTQAELRCPISRSTIRECDSGSPRGREQYPPAASKESH